MGERVSLREGNVYLDGEKVFELVTCSIMFTPEVAESRVIGQRGLSRRWIGYDIAVSISSYKSTPAYKNAVKKYQETGKTPLFTLYGIQDDKASDYNEKYGKDVITVEKMCITSDIPLFQLDSEGELTMEEIEAGAENVIIK